MHHLHPTALTSVIFDSLMVTNGVIRKNHPVSFGGLDAKHEKNDPVIAAQFVVRYQTSQLQQFTIFIADRLTARAIGTPRGYVH